MSVRAKAITIFAAVASVILLAILIPIVLVIKEKIHVYPKFFYSFEDNGDISTIRQRLVERNFDDSVDVSMLIKDVNDNGSFASVDYSGDLQSHWTPIDHLSNVLAMQKAYYTPTHELYQDEFVGNSIIKALEYWAKNDFHCDWNNWYNTIGIGLTLSDIMLFENQGLSQSARDALNAKLKDMSVVSEYRFVNVKQREINSCGGNLTDVINNSIKYAVSVNDGSGIMWMTKLIENELRPFGKKSALAHRYDNEGIKPDMSFWQHFELLYFGGYGEVFCDGINSYLEATRGTQFEVSNKCVNFYADFLLDGMQYAMRGKYRDINASGRGIARPDQLVGIAANVRRGCEVLKTYDNIARLDEIEYLLQNRTAESDVGAGGHKYFYTSDYNVYNANYMATIRHASSETKNSEALNGENVLGHYLGAGATMYYNNGDEYFNILPLWNWNAVPGTTAVQGYLPFGDDRTYSRMGKSSVVGGVSTGNIGASCIDYKDNYVKGKKAWFMFADGVVCLGTDISATRKGDVITNINQTLLRGDVVYSQNRQIKSAKYADINGKFDWIYNNGIAYISNNSLQMKAEQRTGNWKSINTRLAGKAHTDDVLDIGISHGEKPKGAAYNYTVLMNTTAENTQSYSLAPNLVTLSNTDKVQAVMDTKTGNIQAVFWGKGSLKTKDGKTIEASAPCVIAVTGEGIYAACINSNKKLKITCNSKQYNFEFPKGDYHKKTIFTKF